MPKRGSKFYTELVIVTVLSLVAAHGWNRWIGEVINKYYPGELSMHLIFALVATCLAILTLSALFSNKEDTGDKPSLGELRRRI